MMRIFRPLAVVVALLVALSGATAVPAQDDTPNKQGIHLLLDDGRNVWAIEQWPDHVSAAHAIVGDGGYVVQLVQQNDLDVAKWNRFMALCADYNLQPIIRLATDFDDDNGWWVRPTPDDDGHYFGVAAQFAIFLAQLDWPTTPRIIVGNEPNHGTEWGGRPQPAAYALFLRDVATTVRSALPAAIIMNAPVDHYAPHTGNQPFTGNLYYMDAESFLDGMYSADPDIFTLIDAWASHPYPMGAFIQPPWEQSFGIDYINDASNPDRLMPPDGIYNRGINAYEWELLKLASYGISELPIYITETGWRHNAYDPATYPTYPDPDTVARYVDLAMNGNTGRYPDLPTDGWTPLNDDPRVVAVVFFALDGHPREWAHTSWLDMDVQGGINGVLPMAMAFQP